MGGTCPRSPGWGGAALGTFSLTDPLHRAAPGAATAYPQSEGHTPGREKRVNTLYVHSAKYGLLPTAGVRGKCGL